MILAADYPFLDIFWTMIIFFFWVMWFWCLIVVLGDVFRRGDIGGWSKAAWTLFMIIIPLAGVLAYLVFHGKGMGERRASEYAAMQRQMDDHIRSVAANGGGEAPGAAAEISRAKKLLDSGVIDASEYDTLKRKALAV
jgi:hypothetical protein